MVDARRADFAQIISKIIRCKVRSGYDFIRWEVSDIRECPNGLFGDDTKCRFTVGVLDENVICFIRCYERDR